MSPEQCKSVLFRLGIKHGVDPRLISTRLLSPDDKNDMLANRVSFEQLDVAVKLWKAAGMPKNSNGENLPYKADKKY